MAQKSSLFDKVRELILGKGMAKGAADKLKSRSSYIEEAVRKATGTDKKKSK